MAHRRYKYWYAGDGCKYWTTGRTLSTGPDASMAQAKTVFDEAIAYRNHPSPVRLLVP
jgi:hypothetical protein